jgi:hypothetical protein
MLSHAYVWGKHEQAAEVILVDYFATTCHCHPILSLLSLPLSFALQSTFHTITEKNNDSFVYTLQQVPLIRPIFSFHLPVVPPL